MFFNYYTCKTWAKCIYLFAFVIVIDLNFYCIFVYEFWINWVIKEVHNNIIYSLAGFRNKLFINVASKMVNYFFGNSSKSFTCDGWTSLVARELKVNEIPFFVYNSWRLYRFRLYLSFSLGYIASINKEIHFFQRLVF